MLQYFKYVWITGQATCGVKEYQKANAVRRGASESLRKFLAYSESAAKAGTSERDMEATVLSSEH